MKNRACSYVTRRCCCLAFVILLACLIASNGHSAPIFTVDDGGTTIEIIRIKDDISKTPDKYLKIMDRELKKGNLSSVGSLAEQFLRSHPKNQQAREMYAAYFASKGDNKRAREELRKAPPGAKESRYALYAEAATLRLEGDHANAIKTCNKAISLDATHPFPFNILGRVYMEKQEYAKAATFFQKALALEPGFLPGHINLGAAYFSTGDYTKSIECFRKALALNSREFSARYGLALAYEKTGDCSGAISELQACLKDSPQKASALQALIDLQLRTEQFSDAAKTALAMQELGLAEAYEKLGYAHLHLGDAKTAIGYLNKASAPSENAIYMRSICSMSIGEYSAAQKDLDAVFAQKSPSFRRLHCRRFFEAFSRQARRPGGGSHQQVGRT